MNISFIYQANMLKLEREETKPVAYCLEFWTKMDLDANFNLAATFFLSFSIFLESFYTNQEQILQMNMKAVF